MDEQDCDDGLFLSDLPEYLRCIICSLVLRDPVQILQCGHKYCNLCFDRIKGQAQTTGTEILCPMDREVVNANEVRPDLGMKRIIGNLQVKCRQHEGGCTWTGDLSDLNIHWDKCEHRKSSETNFSMTEDSMKKLYERLKQCEASLFDKDKEIASLRGSLRQLDQQQREQKEQQLQQNQEISFLKEKNTFLELELSELKKERQREVSQIKKERQQQELRMDELTGKMERLLQSESKSTQGNKGQAMLTHKKSVVVPTVIPLHRHRGLSGDVTISNDHHRVVFGYFSTVVASSAVVFHGMKVWYEVCFCPDVMADCQQVGWSNFNFDSSEYQESDGVGDDLDSYAFDPFRVAKFHADPVAWGKALNLREGGYVGVALDMVDGRILFSVNGDWNLPMGVAFTDIDTSIPLFPAVTGMQTTIEINFGDREFKYGPPSSVFRRLIDVV